MHPGIAAKSMQNAPAVSFPVGRSMVAARGMAFLWALGVFSAAYLAATTSQPSRTLAIAWVLGLGTGLAALIHWRKLPNGFLRWDRNVWQFAPSKTGIGEPVTLGEVSVCLDLQSILLANFQAPSGRRYWFWLERKADMAQWRILRRAIFAQPRETSAGHRGVANSGKSVAP